MGTNFTFEKINEKFIFKIDEDRFIYSLKENKFYKNEKQISASTFKKYFSCTDFRRLETENNSLGEIYKEIFEIIVSQKTTNIVSVLSMFKDKPNIEAYLLHTLKWNNLLGTKVFTSTNVYKLDILSKHIKDINWIIQNKLYTDKENLEHKIYTFIRFIDKVSLPFKETFIKYMTVFENFLGDKIFFTYNINYDDYLSLYHCFNYVNLNPKDFGNYLHYLKQHECLFSRNMYGISSFNDLFLVKDYYKVISEIQKTIGTKYKLFPKNFLTQKHITLREYERLKFMMERKKLSEPYPYTDTLPFSDNVENYVIMKALDYKSLVEEGKNLCHCVSSYHDSIYDGKSIIYFIRNKNDTKTSLYTMEIKKENNIYYVVQLRGLQNRYLSEDNNIAEAIKKFCKTHNIKIEQNIFLKGDN